MTNNELRTRRADVRGSPNHRSACVLRSRRDGVEPSFEGGTKLLSGHAGCEAAAEFGEEAFQSRGRDEDQRVRVDARGEAVPGATGDQDPAAGYRLDLLGAEGECELPVEHVD